MAIYESVQYRRNGKAIHGNRLDGDYRRRVFTVLPCFALSRNASLGASGPLDKDERSEWGRAFGLLGAVIFVVLRGKEADKRAIEQLSS
ncbi:hypothetical protein LMH87_011114 [Akanthomyces muscarius]|uniref:Uncharacterized protein n=1 Tax=Akanthomyces muscarius TaxID=2231603 RepID=A0A9W8QAN7_AKAMU|nr:hypothetical protein LMH87_011114 [Akanthomyces muscarius]KAJ4150362.1 hypothetical protein LMH87_011114 [Akanthomyces muscarius]